MVQRWSAAGPTKESEVMKPSDIKVGSVYCNRGAGKTLRLVLSIGEVEPPYWLSDRPRPNEPGVQYRDSAGKEGTLYMSFFAQWCGKLVAIEQGNWWVLVTAGVDWTLLEKLNANYHQA